MPRIPPINQDNASAANRALSPVDVASMTRTITAKEINFHFNSEKDVENWQDGSELGQELRDRDTKVQVYRN